MLEAKIKDYINNLVIIDVNLYADFEIYYDDFNRDKYLKYRIMIKLIVKIYVNFRFSLTSLVFFFLGKINKDLYILNKDI